MRSAAFILGLAALLFLPQVSTVPPGGGPLEFDPTRTAEFFDELNYTSLVPTDQNTWFEAAFAAGGAAEATICPVTGFAFGCWRISHGAIDNSGSSYTTAMVEDATTGDWELRGRFQHNITTNIGVWFGLIFHSTINSRTPLLASHAIMMRYDTDATDANYTFQICDAAGIAGCQSTDDDTDSAVAAGTVVASANAWHTVSIRMDQTGIGGNPTLYMRVDSEPEVTFCTSGCTDSITNMPSTTTQLYPFFSCGARDASGTQICYIDYVHFKSSR